VPELVDKGCRAPVTTGAALLPLAFRRRRLSAAARAALVRPEPVRTGPLSATTQPDEHEHQDDEAERAGRAGNREGCPSRYR
jgi:hypothetical protein